MDQPGFAKTLYRILTWSSVVGLVVMLALIMRKSPPPNIPYDPNAAASAEKKFEAADQAQSVGKPSEVQLDRTELNSYLRQNLDLSTPPQSGAANTPTAGGTTLPALAAPATGGAPANDPNAEMSGADQPTIDQVQSSVKDVKVDMVGDVVKAYVIFDFHGKDMSLELDGHLRSENGYMKFEPFSGKLGSLPLPQSTLESAVEKLMSSPENREKLRLPEGVNDLKIQDGQAVVTYNK
jgi:hypothetical protein